MFLLLAACSETELSSTSQEVIHERNATITAGLAHSCAVQPTGTIQCWGRNNYGQLGNNSSVDSAAPVTVNGITTAVMVSAGDYHTCAVLASGTAQCWGLGSSGQLGNGSTTNRSVPVHVSSLTGITSIAAGGSHTCASLETAQVRCWGANSYGQLGTNSTTSATTPQLVLRPGRASPVALTDVLEVEAGKSSTCARQSTGVLQCWGRNNYGQLGDGTSTQRSMAGPVSTLSGTSDLSVGDYHACAVLSNGRVSCWGMNLYGQLGDNTQTGRLTPVQMQRAINPTFNYPIVNVTAVAAGGGHTCVRSAGEVWCAGRNDDGELGRDFTGYLELLAVRSSPVIFADEIATGARHTCARRPGGAIVCVGRDTYGQVGELGRCPAEPTATIASVRALPDSDWPYNARSIDQRGDLYYADGEALEVVVETTACAQLSSVTWKYGPIGPDDPIEPGNAEAYEVLSTVDRADGVRAITVRVRFDNPGTGITYPVAFTVESPAGRTASAGFTLTEALSINTSGGRLDVSNDELLNEALVAIYEKFGDTNYYVRNGVNLYDFDYAAFEINATADGVHFYAKMKGDLVDGPSDSDACNPTVHASGTFKVYVDVADIKTEWVSGPNVFVDTPFACDAATLGLAQMVAVWVSEISLDGKVAKKIDKKVAGLKDYCAAAPGGCTVIQTITHVDGGVTVRLHKIVPTTITFRVPYNTQVHAQSVGDPMRRGIGIPNEPFVIVSGGLARACYGQSTCDTHGFGAQGLFNAQWAPYDPRNPDTDPHPPIPNPWPDCEGIGCYYEGRHGPWLRQVGLSRDPAQMPIADWNVGGLVSRVLRQDGTWSRLQFLGDLVCRVAEAGGTQGRLVVGRNDLPLGPFSGEHGTGDAYVTFNFAGAVGDAVPLCSTMSGNTRPVEPPPTDVVDPG